MSYHQHWREHQHSFHPCDTPIPLSCDLNSSASVYTINDNGDSTPPCMTPFMTVKHSDIRFPHLTLNVWFVYIKINSLKIKGHSSRLNKSL